MPLIHFQYDKNGFSLSVLGIGFGITTETSTKEHSVTIHFKLFKFHTFISFAIL